jgi:amyloid beta precursor protein binding protein 1
LKIPSNVSEVLADSKAAQDHSVEAHTDLTSLLDPFWVLSAALRVFTDRHNGQLPLTGQLPDMTSDTERYTKLLSIYRYILHIPLNFE